MKYIISLMFAALFVTISLTAQNSTKRAKDNSTEDNIKDISSREYFLVENSKNDYTTTSWQRDIYRDIDSRTEGNDVFFVPGNSEEGRANLFSLIMNLLKDKTINAYRYKAQPEFTPANIIDLRSILLNNNIVHSKSGNGLEIKAENIPSDMIFNYYVKEKWYFDTKTNKGDVRVEAICPVLCHNGKMIPLFWVSFDDMSVYLLRTPSSAVIGQGDKSKVLTNTTLFDIFRNRYYKALIYQVGDRQLAKEFKTSEKLNKERNRLEDQLEFIQARFDAIDRNHIE